MIFIKAIVAVDENWAIGLRGEMLFNLPLDLQHFKATTIGGVVILGRNTLTTFPHKKPLEQRTNLILSRFPDLQVEGAVVTNLENLGGTLKDYMDKKVFVIGGSRVYKPLLPYCSQAIVTKIQAKAPVADAFFPNLDQDQNWQIIEVGEEFTDNGIKFSNITYRNNAQINLYISL